jgi:hypothetical protein
VLAAVLLALFAAAGSTPPRFEVAGDAAGGAQGGVEVRLRLANPGGQAAAGVVVAGELAGEFDEARLESVGPGETGAVTLHFPTVPSPAGVHPVALRLDYAPAGQPAAPMSQSAYLLLTVGANPPPAVRLAPAPLELLDHDPLVVRLESADGAAHRVRVRAVTPRGLTAHPKAVDVDVPAQGTATAELPILRGGAPRPSRQGLVVLAETLDGAEKRTSVATAAVDVRPDPALLPRLRAPLAGLALLLALAAGVVEWRRWRRASAPTPAA